MKILFCTDGSQTSYDAAKNFSDIFNPINADVISVSDMTYLPDSILLQAGNYVNLCANSADTILEHSKKILEKLDIKTDRLIKECGNAVDYILDTENKNNYDFIVMGSNGKKGFRKWLGSVSQETASSSKTSVYISKKRLKEKKILFPVTYNDLSDNYIKKVIDKMNFINSEIYLLSVYDIPDFLFLEGNIDSNWSCDIELKQQKEAKKILNSIEMFFANKGIEVKDKTVLRGDVSEQILKFIKANDISIAVTGMRKKRTFSGFVFSSVSRRILENAPCDILIYKSN